MKPLGVYAQVPLRLKSANGAILTDIEGREVLDFYSGHGVISIGHSHPDFVARLSAQLGTLAYYSNVVPIQEQEELCEALTLASGLSCYGLFMSNSGAEAIENALKIASHITGRTQVVAMQGSFHGRTSLAAQVTSASQLKAPIHQGLDVSWVPLGDRAALGNAVTGATAAVIIEGIQGVGGVHEGDSSFWQEAASLAKLSGALLIADEIQSGFGRTGDFFAFQKHSVLPDIICTAKGMGNGFPVAGTWLHERYSMPVGSLGSTFGGGPLAAVAANAVCDILISESLMDNAAKCGLLLRDGLQTLPGVMNVRGRGLMIGFDLRVPSSALRLKLLNSYGILTGSAFDPSTVRLLPPLCISASQCEQLLSALHGALKEENLE